MLLVLTEEHKTHLSFLSTVDISGKREGERERQRGELLMEEWGPDGEMLKEF